MLMRVLCVIGMLLMTISVANADDMVPHLYVVKKRAVSQKLFYSGTVEPLATQAVTASEDGVIEKLHFEYGQPVKKGQLLFTVKSKKFQSNLVSAIKNYLTAKQQLHQSETKLHEQKGLWKYGLISRDAFTSAQTDLYNNQIALLQAQQEMITLLENHKHIKLNYKNLNLSDLSPLKKILSNQYDSDIKSYAPVSGVALIPDKNANQGLDDNDNNRESGPVVIGSAVQQNQAILSIGDLSGATIKIKINEVNVNEIKPGLKAIVTSVAFPGVTLYGKVTSVGSQASSQDSSIPTFPVVVKIEKLTQRQREVIRVGMSAKVELIVSQQPQITVPIDAVTEKNGKDTVQVQTDQGVKAVVVSTAQTTVDAVVIRTGLKVGDKIVLPH